MGRAHRHFLPNKIWHVTHRCHNRSFLLESFFTRQRWVHWLGEATRRYGLSVLDFNATCNHVHLLVDDLSGHLAVPMAMQLMQGRVGREYNDTNGRVGSYWTDRYDATAVESGIHLLRCIGYIGLNMVRAGAVEDPLDWPHCGYSHVQKWRKEDAVIDYERLMYHLRVCDMRELQRRQREIVRTAREKDGLQRNDMWTDAIAVGGESYVDAFASELRRKTGVLKRSQSRSDDGKTVVLREAQVPYGDTSLKSNTHMLHGDNRVPWRLSHWDIYH